MNPKLKPDQKLHIRKNVAGGATGAVLGAVVGGPVGAVVGGLLGTVVGTAAAQSSLGGKGNHSGKGKASGNQKASRLPGPVARAVSNAPRKSKSSVSSSTRARRNSRTHPNGKARRAIPGAKAARRKTKARRG